MTNGRPLTVELQIDYEIIRTFYPDTPMDEMRDLLPHRTEKWIYKAAQKIGIKRATWVIRNNASKANSNRSDLWRPTEDAELLSKWPVLGIKTMIDGRTPYAIEKRAYQLGARFNRQIRHATKHNIWIYNAPTNTNAKHLE